MVNTVYFCFHIKGILYRRVWRPIILLWIRITPSFTSINSVIRYDLNGNLKFNKNTNICCFAHYDTHEKIAPYVLNHLQILRKFNFDIIFVSTGLTKKEADILKPLCVKIIIRKNIGLDFVSWKLAFTYFPKQTIHKNILLVNDSIIGPVESYFKKVLECYDKNSTEVLGLTESNPAIKNKYHLQSYFLLFSLDLFNKKWMKNFWKKIKIVQNKDFIINYYEIGFSQLLLKNKIILNSFISYLKVISHIHCLPNNQVEDIIDYQKQNKKRGLTITSHTWDIIIQNPFYFPYIKRDVLTKKKFRLQMIPHWKSIFPIENYTLIDEYLKRTKGLI